MGPVQLRRPSLEAERTSNLADQIFIVAQRGWNVCDAAHSLFVMKKSGRPRHPTHRKERDEWGARPPVTRPASKRVLLNNLRDRSCAGRVGVVSWIRSLYDVLGYRQR